MKEPLEQLKADFWGRITPASLEKNEYLFVAIFDASAYLWIQPLETKDQCYDAMKDILEEVAKRDTAYEGQRAIKRVRTDSENVIRGKPWKDCLGPGMSSRCARRRIPVSRMASSEG